MKARRASATAGVVATLAGSLTALIVGSPAALAASGQLLIDVPGDGHGWVHDSSHPLLHVANLAPGSSTTADLRLKNDSTQNGTLSVAATKVHDDDNGCVAPESRAGDTTCGNGGGELGHWLRFTVSRIGVSGTDQLWTGNIADLEKGVALGGGVDQHAVLQLRVTAELPYAAGNDVMTDQLGFDLRWTVTSDHSSRSVRTIGDSAPHGGAFPIRDCVIVVPFFGAFAIGAERRRRRSPGAHRG